MNNKNMTIAVLSVTAVALLCTLALMHTWSGSTSVAWADTVDRGGDYVLITGAFSNTDEALYVIDGLNDQLNVYQYDQNRNRIVLYDQANLQDYFVGR